jgi:hypothetical protein
MGFLYFLVLWQSWFLYFSFSTGHRDFSIPKMSWG